MQLIAVLSKAAYCSLLLVLLSCSGGAARAQTGALEEARSLIREGRPGQALEQLNAYLSTEPGDAGARFLKGVALTESGNRREAVGVFIGMTRDFPDLPEPYNNLAVLRALEGDLEAARLALLEAIRIHPSYATAHENLGDVYAKMAAVEFAQAARLDATNTTAAEKLAWVDGLAPPAVHGAAVGIAAGDPMTHSAEGVLAMVRDWADAWSKQDIEGYLAHYGAGFTPAHGAARDAWASLRRKRLQTPGFIRVGIESPKVRIENESRASVQFTQSYQSDTYSDRVLKRLDLVNEGGDWKISRETTID